MAEDDVADDSVEDGIAEKLQPLVVDFLAFGVAVGNALVHQRNLIETDVVGKDAENSVQRQIKLLILSEREPYSIDDIIQHTS